MIQIKFLCVFVIVHLCFGLCLTDNFTTAYRRVVDRNGPKHEPRFLTFNTDDGDLSIDLEFAVPFITIPVKKTVDAAMGLYKGQMANINIGSLILTGAVIFGAAFVIPFTSSLFFKHMLMNPFQRSSESNESWRIMTLVDQALIENNIDTTSCMQKAMCWLAKNVRNKLNKGEATSQDKIIDGLMTNSWVNHLIEGSAIQTAIQQGLDSINCNAQYKNCKITQNSLQKFTQKLANYLQMK